MDELNLHLQSLIQEVCSDTPSTPKHRQALNRLLRVILKSGRIWRPSVGDVYEENLYEEALNKTMFNLTKTLCDRYNPNQGSFFAWFNTCLRHQYTDEIRAVKRDRARIQSGWQSDEMKFEDPLDRVDSPVDATLLLQTWELFVEWIANDSDGILNGCHIENNPKANCQLLAHLRLVVGKEWQGIAAEVGSSRGAVTSHWCRKCEFLLREWLSTNQKLFGEDNYE
jgi:hypothetical protein